MKAWGYSLLVAVTAAIAGPAIHPTQAQVPSSVLPGPPAPVPAPPSTDAPAIIPLTPAANGGTSASTVLPPAASPQTAIIPLPAQDPVIPLTPAKQAPSEDQAASAQAPAPRPAPGSPLPAATSPDSATAALIDETALAYFARNGETERYASEIARLQVLYPGWVPPTPPFDPPPIQDSRLTALWQLYAQGQLRAVRDAIALRQLAEPGWASPPDLTARLAVAETRERIMAAADAGQYKMVVNLAAQTPSLLTCGDTQVLQRLAGAFGKTERQNRALDVYRYILTRCTDPKRRLDAMTDAAGWLARPDLDALLSLGVDGDEFRSIRERLARDALAATTNDPKAVIDEGDLRRLQDMADANGSAADAQALGRYFLRDGDAAQAERWYRLAYERQTGADAAGGLGAALLVLKRPVDAEAVLAPWQKGDEGVAKSYLDAVGQILAIRPPSFLAPEVLSRMASAVAVARRADLAKEFGWYAHSFRQDVTALRWFATALDWRPDDEPAAYGFAVVGKALGRRDALQDVLKAWGSRSPRIRAMAEAGAARPPASRQKPGETKKSPRELDLAASPSSSTSAR